MLASIEALLSWLRTALAALEDQIEARLASNTMWRDQAAVLGSVPGVGKVTVSTRRLRREPAEEPDQPTDPASYPAPQLTVPMLSADGVRR